MSFWTTQKIRETLKGENSPIVEPKMERINNACYEMALGSEAFITSVAKTKRVYKFGEQMLIPPGQMALLLTEEELRIPLDVLAFISIKAAKKIGGLVNVSGFHVDPGFQGRLKFSVYNAGSEAVILEVGERLFPIWFYQLDANNEDDYNGKHKHQVGISPDDVMKLQGEVASPAALKKEIDELRSTITNWKAVTIGALTTAVATAIAAIVTTILKS